MAISLATYDVLALMISCISSGHCGMQLEDLPSLYRSASSLELLAGVRDLAANQYTHSAPMRDSLLDSWLHV